MRGNVSRLTKKQQAFVNEYLKDRNGTAAAIRAGYSEATADTQASRMLRHVKVRAALEQAEQDRGIRLKVTSDMVTKRLAQIAFYDPISRPDEDLAALGVRSSDVTKSLEMLGKELGMFVDRKEISGPNGGPIQSEDMQVIIDAAATCRAYMMARQDEIRAEEKRRKALGDA